ncbi:unnamed protein product [Pleuronectes platessa]|uniref:Uncharacterized protein n=1 Tax=Pleuronectes platessa TaxID=8262 RepID=A0A9N7UFA0_PLEPL|nr:unnamed protein product [Pleuronectes platessa]
MKKSCGTPAHLQGTPGSQDTHGITTVHQADFGPGPSPWFLRFAWLSRRQQPPSLHPSTPPPAPKCVSSPSSHPPLLLLSTLPPCNTSPRLPQHIVSLRTH